MPAQELNACLSSPLPASILACTRRRLGARSRRSSLDMTRVSAGAPLQLPPLPLPQLWQQGTFPASHLCRAASAASSLPGGAPADAVPTVAMNPAAQTTACSLRWAVGHSESDVATSQPAPQLQDAPEDSSTADYNTIAQEDSSTAHVRPPYDTAAIGRGARRGGLFSSLRARLNCILEISSFALPLAVQNIMGYSLNALSSSLIGRLGPTQQSASTLGNSAYSMTGLSLVWGGAAGLETLCGQANGAGNARLMRLVVLRAVLVSWAVCVPVVALWGRAEALLSSLGQSPALVVPAATYLQSLAPSLFFYSLSECLQVFLVVQGLTRATTLAKMVVTVLGPLYYWGCMFGLKLGLSGAGFAYALCKATNAALLLAYIVWTATRKAGRSVRGTSPEEGVQERVELLPGGDSAEGTAAEAEAMSPGRALSLGMIAAPMAMTALTKQQQTQQEEKGGKTKRPVGTERDRGGGRGRGRLFIKLRALSAAVRSEVAAALSPVGCREYIRFGVPAAVMCCLEWWAYEGLVVITGWLPNADLAVGCIGVCLTVSGWVYMVPQAIASATCARVAGALGSGDAGAAKRYCESGAVLVVALQAGICAALLPQVGAVASWFCAEPAAAALTASLLPITALSTLGEGLNCVLNNGVLRACGRQDLGARLHLTAYWLCGLPAAYAASFPLGLGVHGLLIAMGITSLVQSLVVVGIIGRWDWQVEVRNSRALLSKVAAGSDGAGEGAEAGLEDTTSAEASGMGSTKAIV